MLSNWLTPRTLPLPGRAGSMLQWAEPLLTTGKGQSIKQETGSSGGILPVFVLTHMTVYKPRPPTHTHTAPKQSLAPPPSRSSTCYWLVYCESGQTGGRTTHTIKDETNKKMLDTFKATQLEQGRTRTGSEPLNMSAIFVPLDV